MCSREPCNKASPEQACVGVGAAAHDLIGLFLTAQAAHMVKSLCHLRHSLDSPPETAHLQPTQGSDYTTPDS